MKKAILSLALSLVSTSNVSASPPAGSISLNPDVILKAWTDKDFLKALKTDPISTLNIDISQTQQLKVFIHENTYQKTHIVLPTMPEHLAQVDSSQNETGLLEAGILPASLSHQIQLNPSLKQQLLDNPNKTLKSLGYATTANLKFHENQLNSINLVIPKLPIDIKQSKKIENAAINLAGSTKCCATGTYDNGTCFGCHAESKVVVDLDAKFIQDTHISSLAYRYKDLNTRAVSKQDLAILSTLRSN